MAAWDMRVAKPWLGYLGGVAEEPRGVPGAGGVDPILVVRLCTFNSL